MRRSYERGSLDRGDLAATWLEQFDSWFGEAKDTVEFPEPNAMAVATADLTGQPHVRTLLCKAYDEQGLVFFTNHRSVKGQDLAANPKVSAMFAWYQLERQVIVTGRAQRLGPAESAPYFHSRPHGSQLAASISEQSQVIPDRAWLQRRFDELAQRYPDGRQVPLPEFWGGVRIVPETVEFWQGRPDRLHDRLRYARSGGNDWVIERLAP